MSISHSILVPVRNPKKLACKQFTARTAERLVDKAISATNGKLNEQTLACLVEAFITSKERM